MFHSLWLLLHSNLQYSKAYLKVHIVATFTYITMFLSRWRLLTYENVDTQVFCFAEPLKEQGYNFSPSLS